MVDEYKLTKFIVAFPLFLSTVRTLQDAKIDWMISGSGCLYLLGNERFPDDVDIPLRDEDHDAADKLFEISSYFYRSEQETIRNSNPSDDHSIQLTSHVQFLIDGHEYLIPTNQTMIDNRRLGGVVEGLKIWLSPPEDVLLIKALLQRGKDVGKNDLEDIRQFLSMYPELNRAYLLARIKEVNAEERVGTIFD